MPIVTTHYRYKRPPRKRKPVALPTGRIVRPVEPSGPIEEMSRAATFPAVVRKAKPGNDNRAEAATSPHDGTRSAIVTTTNRKRLKLLRADKRAPTTDDDPEMRAWLLRAMKGGGPRDD